MANAMFERASAILRRALDRHASSIHPLGECALAARPLVMTDHFFDDEAQELLAEFRIQVGFL